MVSSCKKNTDTAVDKAAISIGASYQGGVIFYLDGTGQHGLVAAPSDQSSGIRWYNGTYVAANTVETSVGMGLVYTNAIVNLQGTGSYAASLCKQLSLNGYNDWFLPSKNELNLLYQNRNQVGGFATGYYWSCCEYDTQNAWNQYFPYGPQYYANKSSLAYVRAIRAF